LRNDLEFNYKVGAPAKAFGKRGGDVAKVRKHSRVPSTSTSRKEDVRRLDFIYFERSAQAESFSAEAVYRLRDSPFFCPDTNPDGSITDHSLLTMASVVIAAADRQIHATQDVRARIAWWNSPLFQRPVLDSNATLNSDPTEGDAAKHK
jgi:hypothetical protein